MRIVVVSAHYPPNFISGGTLQPQRLARGLQDRGHDVHVYAGWLGAREGLTVWDEIDETGLPVHWISIGPYIGWSDERNFDHPAVRDEFARYLGEVQPDLVHLHSLQALGAGLARAARVAGARVVLTMHDFWWMCARQFLVDRHNQPCSLVVSCGVCQCQVERAWLERRDRFLAEQLQAVDLVLAPSASAASVFAANGIDPDRLAVDENGLPPTTQNVPDVGGAGAPDVVRFTYVGGPNEMKGVHVVLEATRRLRGVGRWRLTVHGIDEYLQRTGDRIDMPRVQAAPAFPPERLDAVMADSDVVVIPSVMRETHSLVTREALERGVPVVCTDSLGPEEVVVDGTNGLVVPSADAEALSWALRRLVIEPGLLARLRSGVRSTPVRVRPLADQLAGLEARYAELVAGPGERHRERPSIGRVLFMVGIEGAPLRYRARLPAEALGLVGVASDVVHYRDHRLPRLVDAADVVVVYRVPATVQVIELIERARARGVPVVFDVDDLIFDPDIRSEIAALRLLPPDQAELWLQGVHRYRTTLEHCDGYIGSTQALVDHAVEVTGLPAARFDNGVGILLARQSDREVARARRPGPLRIGYLSGTITHDEDWFFVEPAVVATLDRFPEVEVWLGGHLPDSPALRRFGARVHRLPFLPWLELPGVVRDLDVNLAPLAPGSRFNEAKSAIKWLEAALVATPTIASPTDPFLDAIDDGRSGLIARSPAEWRDALARLLVDPLLRARMGAAARRGALLRWSPHLQGRRYLEILEQAHEWRDCHRPADRSWVDVALDEPLIPVEPESYTAADVAVAATELDRHDARARHPRPRTWVRPAGVGQVLDRVRAAGVIRRLSPPR